MKKGIFFSFILTALLLASCKGPAVNTDTNTNTETPDVAEETTMQDDMADDTDAMGDMDADDDMMDDDMEMSDDTDTMDDDMSDDMDADDDMMDDDDSMIELDADTSANLETLSAGTYAPYTEEAAANASGKVVLAFHADWCPTCVEARKNFKENPDDIPAGVTVLDVNYDDAQALKEKYNVTSQHTYVQIDSAGELLKKWKGGATVAEITGQVQ